MTSIQENQTRLVQVYIRVMGVITLITFPIFIGFSAVAEEFVILFLGEKWKPIIPIIVILSFARLITPISGLNLNILNAKGRSDLFLKTDLSKLPMTVAAIVISIPYGIMGMAIAQLCTTFISFFINSYYPGKLFGFGAKNQLKQILPIAVSSLIMYLSIHFISIDNMALQMCTKIIVGACVYITACWILKIPAFIDIVHIVFSRFIAKP
jgi:O-antigen/teichoic acid export membrane protein